MCCSNTCFRLADTLVSDEFWSWIMNPSLVISLRVRSAHYESRRLSCPKICWCLLPSCPWCSGGTHSSTTLQSHSFYLFVFQLKTFFFHSTDEGRLFLTLCQWALTDRLCLFWFVIHIPLLYKTNSFLKAVFIFAYTLYLSFAIFLFLNPKRKERKHIFRLMEKESFAFFPLFCDLLTECFNWKMFLFHSVLHAAPWITLISNINSKIGGDLEHSFHEEFTDLRKVILNNI